MLYLTENDVRSILTMEEAIRLMGECFAQLRAGTARNQPRRRLFTPQGSVLHALAGATPKYFGTKIYGTHVRHGAHFFFHLFDAETARPLALMEANWLGQIRTGAASGYATGLLAPPDARTVGVIGSGFQARSQVEAIRVVRPGVDVRVWSRSPEKRERFASEVGASAAAGARQAVEDADIVVTATWSKDPVIEAGWVKAGAHVNAMGSNNPDRRELPAGLLDRAALIAVDALDVAKIESGDLLLAWGGGDWSGRPVQELKDVSPPRPDGITIFKSNGLGVEDVAAGGWVYEQAAARGIGVRMGTTA